MTALQIAPYIVVPLLTVAVVLWALSYVGEKAEAE